MKKAGKLSGNDVCSGAFRYGARKERTDVFVSTKLSLMLATVPATKEYHW